MKTDRSKEETGLFKSVVMAYFVLLLHVALIAGLGLLVIFFHGIVNYMVWIFLGGSTVALVSAYLFYKRMKAEGRTLREMLRSPMFGGRSVEVSLLGGLATFRLGRPDPRPEIDYDPLYSHRQIEDPATAQLRHLAELARLYEKELITLDEYNRAKAQIFRKTG